MFSTISFTYDCNTIDNVVKSLFINKLIWIRATKPSFLVYLYFITTTKNSLRLRYTSKALYLLPLYIKVNFLQCYCWYPTKFQQLITTAKTWRHCHSEKSSKSNRKVLSTVRSIQFVSVLNRKKFAYLFLCLSLLSHFFITIFYWFDCCRIVLLLKWATN